MADPTEITELTADIVSAFVANNTVAASEVASLIATVHASLTNLGQPVIEAEPEVAKPTTAQIRRSVQDEGITSFLDGKRYKSMKRHLTIRGMTPESYRETYGLPKDYPMVAPSYARARSALAKSMGLGQGGRQAKKTAPAKAPAKRGRPKAG